MMYHVEVDGPGKKTRQRWYIKTQGKKNTILFLLFLKCPFITLHIFLSVVALSNDFLCTILSQFLLFHPFYYIILTQAIRKVTCCVFVSIQPGSAKFSSTSFFIICPRIFNCLFLVIKKCVFFVPVYLNYLHALSMAFNHPTVERH